MMALPRTPITGDFECLWLRYVSSWKKYFSSPTRCTSGLGRYALLGQKTGLEATKTHKIPDFDPLGRSPAQGVQRVDTDFS